MKKLRSDVRVTVADTVSGALVRLYKESAGAIDKANANASVTKK